MIYTDTDRDTLIRSICEQPFDDSPRLIFADWLEECHIDYCVCSRCNGYGKTEFPNGNVIGIGNPFVVPCPQCSGKGRFVSNDYRERAEFIRLQIEIRGFEILAGHRLAYGCYCVHCQNANPLKYRSQDLLDLHAEEWVGDLAKNRVAGWTGSFECVLILRGSKTMKDAPVCVFSRGFVSEIRLTCDDFMKHAKELFAEHPITKVVLTDAVIRPSGGNDTYYIGGLGSFPAKYWSGLENAKSRFDLLAHISNVCVKYGRELAGLQQIDWSKER